MKPSNTLRHARRCMSAAMLLAAAGAAQAALISLGDGTVKDSNTNLIWLQDWNLLGQGNWGTQNERANVLTFAGSSDWALPTISELRALFDAYNDLTAVSNFKNVRSDGYWSSTEDPSGTRAEYLYSTNAFGLSVGKTFVLSAVAVRPGGVVAPVPEPQTLALALLALGVTAAVRRRSAGT